MVDRHQLVERHLTVPDLAERLGVPVQTVYNWNSQRTGPTYMKIGRHARYRLADVEAWERAQAVEADDR